MVKELARRMMAAMMTAVVSRTVRGAGPVWVMAALTVVLAAAAIVTGTGGGVPTGISWI
ncbi:hypothetical protein GCM10009677_62820 [Sphaerisporangium rubeum]|uniref:Methylthioribose-1-phosphate isomerase n=1 Tax=Sphaerisporangium rubeum TaxID=321317 RepID=A0A7X0ILT5_9ACTN|nr:hypothetical protein [Sphaerisporangium rubeum]MBB6476097.1 methylthioribose-1-phosphate isomerase [Sphaerisporangium rubeum]